jgi:glycosyltransferase involved in cell wall biosynthesis
MRKSNPKVSVCIPVYNCEAYLANTIRSVLAQSLTDFELVIIDNASTDRTAEIISGFEDPRLRSLRNEKNLGMMGNWNRCLEEARGEFINCFRQTT